jgi:hypothetical protein
MKKFVAYFFDGDQDDMFANMVGAKLIEAPTEAIASADALQILRSNPNYKSYGVNKYSDDVLNMKCHCAIDGRDSYMPLKDAIEWFNQMVFEGNTRIRVWAMYEPELTIPTESVHDNEPDEDLIMYSGDLPS